MFVFDAVAVIKQILLASDLMLTSGHVGSNFLSDQTNMLYWLELASFHNRDLHLLIGSCLWLYTRLQGMQHKLTLTADVIHSLAEIHHFTYRQKKLFFVAVFIYLLFFCFKKERHNYLNGLIFPYRSEQDAVTRLILLFYLFEPVLGKSNFFPIVSVGQVIQVIN